MASMTATEELSLLRSEVRKLASAHPREAKRMMTLLRLLSPKLHALFAHYLKGILT